MQFLQIRTSHGNLSCFYNQISLNKTKCHQENSRSQKTEQPKAASSHTRPGITQSKSTSRYSQVSSKTKEGNSTQSEQASTSKGKYLKTIGTESGGHRLAKETSLTKIMTMTYLTYQLMRWSSEERMISSQIAFLSRSKPNPVSLIAKIIFQSLILGSTGIRYLRRIYEPHIN